MTNPFKFMSLNMFVFSFLNMYFYFMPVSVGVHVVHPHAVPTEVTESPGAEIMGGCELLCEQWEPNPGLLLEQPVFLPTEPSLQPWTLYPPVSTSRVLGSQAFSFLAGVLVCFVCICLLVSLAGFWFCMIFKCNILNLFFDNFTYVF